MNVTAKERSDKTLSGLTFGVEWGYVATLVTGIFNDYFLPEGYRTEDRELSIGLTSNAEIYANIGYNFNNNWNLSLYVGYEGIATFNRAVPISLRLTRYFSENRKADRWFAFAEAGSGICLKSYPQEIVTGKLGGGYRLALSSTTSLDFILAGKLVYDHAYIEYENTIIPMDKIITNIACAGAISFSVALNF